MHNLFIGLVEEIYSYQRILYLLLPALMKEMGNRTGPKDFMGKYLWLFHLPLRASFADDAWELQNVGLHRGRRRRFYLLAHETAIT